MMHMDKVTEIPFLSNIGLILTYKCTIACPHCIIEAGPHRKEELSLKNAYKWIKEVSQYRDGHIKGISLTGGEPFFSIENLKKISRYAHGLGLLVSVVTNAFWATSKSEALKILEELSAIQLISLSTDIYHQTQIPLSNIENAVWAAKKLNKRYNIAVCAENEDNIQYKNLIEDLKKFTEKDNINYSITLPLGRAQKISDKISYPTSSEPTLSACTMASSPVIFPDGKILGCIGPLITLDPPHPLFLGNLYQNSLSEILDNAEISPILHTLRIWGPRKIVSLIKEYGMDNILIDDYIDDCVCDACYKLLYKKEIREFLTNIAKEEKYKEKIAYARIYHLNEIKMAEQLQLNKQKN